MSNGNDVPASSDFDEAPTYAQKWVRVTKSMMKYYQTQIEILDDRLRGLMKENEELKTALEDTQKKLVDRTTEAWEDAWIPQLRDAFLVSKTYTQFIFNIFIV